MCYRLLLCSHRQSGGKALSADIEISEWSIESHKSTTIVNALFLIYLPWIEDPIIYAIIRKYLEISSVCSDSWDRQTDLRSNCRLEEKDGSLCHLQFCSG